MGGLKRRITMVPGGGLEHVEGHKPAPKPVQHDPPMYLKFAFGTASALSATFFTHPIDVVKYTMQLESGNLFQTSKSIFGRSGSSGFYKGLSASMMRQASYGTTRLGIYTTLLERYKNEDGTPPPLYKKLLFSMTAGGVGGFVGNPFDLALVRMAADPGLPVDQRRNYKGVFDAVARITRTEGFTSLWIGCGPTVSRCVVLNMAQLTSYSQAKEELLKTSYFVDNIWCHLTSSMISGFVATAASTPFDVAKTRIQYDHSGKYKGMADCLFKTFRTEGPLSLWSGFSAAYLRLAPQTVLIFIFLEQLNKGYQVYMNK